MMEYCIKEASRCIHDLKVLGLVCDMVRTRGHNSEKYDPLTDRLE